MGVDFVLKDPTEGPNDDDPISEGEYLCYYEFHVGKHTFYIHCLVHANSSSEALDKLGESVFEDNFHLQPKGCYGKFDLGRHLKFLKSVGGGIKLP